MAVRPTHVRGLARRAAGPPITDATLLDADTAWAGLVEEVTAPAPSHLTEAEWDATVCDLLRGALADGR